ncbi:MAG: TIGR01777 family oxidoreductase [Sphingobacteriales bacterium]|nr:TIGR01777 family oxidoreductase [Sphingobacteriales bacterium]
MPTILITGGTGLIGKTLTPMLLEKGYRVIILTRKIPTGSIPEGVSYALWDLHKKTIDLSALQEADYIIHLAGAGVVEKKWTKAYQQEIINSRVNSSALLIEQLTRHSNSVKAMISTSAIGWYGPDKIPDGREQPFTESDPADHSFLGATCRLWEESVAPITALGKRLVILRTGIVLSQQGGALVEFKKPIQFGIAGILGSGKQMVSWIHITDLCRLFIYALEENIHGVYNAVAPVPVNNKTLTLQLARKMRGRFFIPIHIPAFVLKLMMGERSIEVLKSTTVSSIKIKDQGFVFLYPSIESALAELFNTTDQHE